MPNDYDPRERGWNGGDSRQSRPPNILAGRYEVLDEIGSGASAVTYRGRDQRLDRLVAIKVLRRDYALDPTYVQRFEREARTAASVAHGNVVDVYDFGQQDGVLYIVMQLVDGEDLKHLITREGALPPERAREITHQVLAGLRAIHAAGIVHRDIKPQNVLIGRDDVARVTDFGVAQVTIDVGLTTAGTTVGTAAYMAPEQAQAGRLTEATDLYSVGVMLYEMLTGVMPFEASTAVAMMLAHVQQQPVPPSRRAPGRSISPELDGIVMQAMAKDPNDRFRSAAAMDAALAGASLATISSGGTTTALPAARQGTSVFPADRPERSVAPWLRESTGGGSRPPAAPPPADRERDEGRGLRGVLGGLLLLLLLGLAAFAAYTVISGRGDGDDDATDVPGAGQEETATQQDAPTDVPTEEPTRVVESTDEPEPTDPPADEPAEPTDEPIGPPEEPSDDSDEEVIVPPATDPPPAEPTDEPEPTATAAPVEPIEEQEVQDPGEDGEPTSPPIEPVDAQGEEQSDGQARSARSEIALVRSNSSNSQSAEEDQDAAVEAVELTFDAQDWSGGERADEAQGRSSVTLYGEGSGLSEATLSFELGGTPVEESFSLTIEGVTSDGDEVPIAVLVNGDDVQSLPSPFESAGNADDDEPWSSYTFVLPADGLQEGANAVSVVNQASSGEVGAPPSIMLASAVITLQIEQAMQPTLLSAWPRVPGAA